MVKGVDNKPFLDSGIQIKFNDFSELWETHPDGNTDLAVMPLKLAVKKCRYS